MTIREFVQHVVRRQKHVYVVQQLKRIQQLLKPKAQVSFSDQNLSVVRRRRGRCHLLS